MNNWNVTGFTTAGRRHLSLGKENEDGFMVYEDERILALAVADGCSDSPCAKAASEAVLNALMEFSKGDIFDKKVKYVKAEVLNVIDKHLLAAPYEYRLLACTCALVVYNKISDTYIALSIGDCQVSVLTDKLEPKLLLGPVNIFRHRNQTVFANSSMATNAMKLEVGSAKGISGMALITDGAECMFSVDSKEDFVQLASVCVLSKEYADDRLTSYVTDTVATKTSDDITVLMAMRSDNESVTKIAEATCDVMIENDTVPDFATEVPKNEEICYIDTDVEKLDDHEVNAATTTILEFLVTPRTAEELVIAGFCTPSQVISYLYPLLKEKLVSYEDYHFSTVK